MMQDLEGNSGLVTGGASGIGFGMAHAFGRAGMNVVIADIDFDVAARRRKCCQRDQIRGDRRPIAT